MAAELKLNWQSFNEALSRRIATSGRLAQEVIVEQARGLFRQIIAVTPPGHAGVKAGTRGAQARGEAKVAADISKLYGTPSTAYDLLKEQKGEVIANAFWKAKTRSPAAAAKITREHLDASFSPFDGGALHRRMFKRGRVRAGRRKAPFIIVRESRELKAYIAKIQERVHYLAGGHESIAKRLGIALPGMIAKHDAPSLAELVFSELLLRIKATNAVKYASNTDLERRIQFAIDGQRHAMQRQWRHFTRQMWERGGFKVRAD